MRVDLLELLRNKVTSTTENNLSKMQSEDSQFLQNLSKYTPQAPGNKSQKSKKGLAWLSLTPMNQNQIQEKKPEETLPEFVQIGDFVRIECIEKIFDGLKEYTKVEGGQTNIDLAKILDKSDFDYKSEVFSDGIAERDWVVIPKDTRKGMKREHTDQGKSIFSIEMQQEFKLLAHHFLFFFFLIVTIFLFKQLVQVCFILLANPFIPVQLSPFL